MEPKQTQTYQGPIRFYSTKESYGQFSNFYKSEIIIDEKIWPTVEHYFQAQKFAGVDDNYMEKIRTCKGATLAKRLGNTRSVRLRSDWQEVKYDVMIKALQAKFVQKVKLKKVLLDTRDREIIEAAKNDYEWGCGLKGTGKNLLGKALMEVREQIKKGALL